MVGNGLACIISVRWLGPLPDGTQQLSHDRYRQRILEVNGTQILEEFGLSSLGRGGPAFDTKIAAGKTVQRGRVVFIPADSGVLEIAVTADLKTFPQACQALNVILVSLRQSDPSGKLQMPEIKQSV